MYINTGVSMEIELWGCREKVPGLIFEQSDNEVCIEQEITSADKDHSSVVIPADQCRKIGEWLLTYAEENGV